MKTAAVTMVYKDHWYLEKWVQYYGQLFGAENLHIISHGDDPVHCALAKDCNHIRVPHNQLPEDFDEQRWRMLSDPCAVLIKSYDWVICGDVDEIILPTRTDETLPEALESDLEELKKTPSDKRTYRQSALISWGHVQRRKAKGAVPEVLEDGIVPLKDAAQQAAPPLAKTMKVLNGAEYRVTPRKLRHVQICAQVDDRLAELFS